jgi:serine/threonine protein phosphatase PrpC
MCLQEKGGISAEPELSRHTMCSDDTCMVLASDGVWEMMTNEEVLECVAQERHAGDACKALIEEVRPRVRAGAEVPDEGDLGSAQARAALTVP